MLTAGPRIAAMLGLRDGVVVRLVANDRVIVEARATIYQRREIYLMSGGRAAELVRTLAKRCNPVEKGYNFWWLPHPALAGVAAVASAAAQHNLQRTLHY